MRRFLRLPTGVSRGLWSVALLLCLAAGPAFGESAISGPAPAPQGATGTIQFKDGLQPAAKGAAPSKHKTCCGYPLVKAGEWALRFYWMTEQERYEDHYDEQDVYTRDGIYIGSFPEKFIKSLKMEGTAKLTDGRVLNFHGRCVYGVGTCFQTLDPARHPHGRGAGRRPLIPFQSVAVDPRLVAIGEPLYIAEFDGVRMPDGRMHDGCVRADDTGGSIKKRKMDFFVETRDNWRFILDKLYGRVWMTPEIEHPRCQYLRAGR